MKYITLRKLENLGACSEQRRLFKRLFGSRVAVTEAKLLPHANKFNWRWAADHLLSAWAWGEHEQATARVWAEDNKARASAFIRFYNLET
jgi:hypothetical protein